MLVDLAAYMKSTYTCYELRDAYALGLPQSSARARRGMTRLSDYTSLEMGLPGNTREYGHRLDM